MCEVVKSLVYYSSLWCALGWLLANGSASFLLCKLQKGVVVHTGVCLSLRTPNFFHVMCFSPPLSKARQCQASTCERWGWGCQQREAADCQWWWAERHPGNQRVNQGERRGNFVGQTVQCGTPTFHSAKECLNMKSWFQASNIMKPALSLGNRGLITATAQPLWMNIQPCGVALKRLVVSIKWQSTVFVCHGFRLLLAAQGTATVDYLCIFKNMRTLTFIMDNKITMTLIKSTFIRARWWVYNRTKTVWRSPEKLSFSLRLLPTHFV